MSLLFLPVWPSWPGFFGKHLPVYFLPDEDQGYFYAGLQLPDAASLQRTDDVTRRPRKSSRRRRA